MAYPFTDQQIVRYSRQMVMPEVGGKGQERLLKGRVLCVGAGGLGSPAVQYLAAAGVGTLGIMDYDTVDLSNLQRQTIHAGNVGKGKARSAAEFVTRLNPDVKTRVYEEPLSADNARRVFRDYDFIVDGSDNFSTRYLVNDAALLEGKPFSHGAILRFEGQVLTVVPGKGPCYRCVFVEAPPAGTVPTCQEAGVLGAIPGIVASIQAAEAMRHLLGKGDLLVGRLLLVDALRMSFTELRVRRNPACPACGDAPALTDLKAENYRDTCSLSPSRR
jgi:adenylyltransferase/sulfurtransferase